MCDMCFMKFEAIIAGATELIDEAYGTQFGVKDDLTPQDYDVMGSIALAIAGDYFRLASASGEGDPYDRMLEIIAKANGAQGVMFIGGKWPSPAELGVKDIKLYADAEGKRGIGIGHIPPAKKEDLQ